MSTARSAGSRVRGSPYHAVEILPGNGACAAAEALRGQRFLSREASLLPLPNCDHESCKCIYQHYEDRRKESRRKRRGQGTSESAPGEKERRIGRGRRQTD
jgi:hypothetical protein